VICTFLSPSIKNSIINPVATEAFGPGEEIHDMDIDHGLGTIYATGQYSYLVNDSKGNAEQVQHEDDVVYVINDINHSRGYSASEQL
jgi:hypothetical protein